MIRNLVLVSIFLFSGVTFSTAQHSHDDNVESEHFCGTNDALERLLDEHPEYAPLIQAAENQLERFTEEFSESDFDRSGSNYIIPVVFHIIHANGPENISDEQVYNAIDVMTEDFTMNNSDLSGVIPEFEDAVADVGVEFRLARLDPDGNCTNGIIRTIDSQTFEGGENLKDISLPWPRSNYLNIWVAAGLSGGAAGYTYNPASVDGFWGAEADGIVILHNYVGGIGTSTATKRHTLTHEVGHWINLRHPWGGTNDPGLDDNCNSDDNVSDTPNTIGWTSCSIYGETCGSLDNVQNFMEYSYCTNMFTLGQRNRMLASLNSSISDRNNLHSNGNLVATGVIGEPQLCSVEIETSSDLICAGDSVVYTDHSYHGVTTRNWTFEGGTPSTASGEEVVVYYNEPGTFSVELEIENNSGESINEQFENIIQVWPAVGIPLDYSENFEENPDLDEEWIVINTGTTAPWQISDNVSGASGNHALMLPNRSLSEGDESEIWSHPIDLSNTNTSVEISFNYAYTRRNSSNNERLQLWVSRNCGESWSMRGVWNFNFETAPFTNSDWVPSSSAHWETVTVDNISSSYLVSNFMFKFVFESDGGNNLFIDDINITGPDATSVENLDISNSIDIFPNPVRDQLNVTISGERPYNFRMQLINTVGQTVWLQDQVKFGGGSQQFEVNTSDLSPGVYMLHIETEAGLRAVKRVMVTR